MGELSGQGKTPAFTNRYEKSSPFTNFPVALKFVFCERPPIEAPAAIGLGRRQMAYLVVCGSVELKRFWTKADADAFARSWTKYGANARVITVAL
jgi:hypothetical protein